MPAQPSSALALAGLLAGAGVTHFAVPRFYDAMIPAALPGSARTWTLGSGVVEFAVAATVANPTTRRAGAQAAAALFVAVFPANVKMAADAFRNPKAGRATKLGMLVRLPVQLPLVRWALTVADGHRTAAADSH